MRVLIVGCGYVGLPLGVGAAVGDELVAACLQGIDDPLGCFRRFGVQHLAAGGGGGSGVGEHTQPFEGRHPVRGWKDLGSWPVGA